MKLLVSGLLLLEALSGGTQRFDYLEGSGNRLRTTHEARYRIAVDRSFRRLGEFRHRPVYEGTRFDVTLAGFARGDELAMVHAERKSDGSGGLDYSNLEPADFGGIALHHRFSCVTAAEVPDPYANPELAFIRDRGFQVRLPMAFAQYYLTSADGKAEIVLTYGRRLPDCSASVVTPQLTTEIQQRARAVLRLTRIEGEGKK